MNIVHIIGNGFDLNLDLKTSYKDFYDYYIKINSKNEIIELLKREIKSNSENWSDRRASSKPATWCWRARSMPRARATG